MPFKFLPVDEIKLKILRSIHENYMELREEYTSRTESSFFKIKEYVQIYNLSQLTLGKLKQNKYVFGEFRNPSSGNLGRIRLKSFMIGLATAASVDALIKMIEESESYKYGSNFRKAINMALLDSVDIKLKDGMFLPVLKVANNLPDALKDAGGKFFTASLKKVENAYESTRESVRTEIILLADKCGYYDTKPKEEHSSSYCEALDHGKEGRDLFLLSQLYH